MKNGAQGISLWIVIRSGGGWCGQKTAQMKCPASCVATIAASLSLSSVRSSNSVRPRSTSFGVVSPVTSSRSRSRATERHRAFRWSPLNGVPVGVMYCSLVRRTA